MKVSTIFGRCILYPTDFYRALYLLFSTFTKQLLLYFSVTSKRVEIIRSHDKTNELFTAREGALRQSQSFQQFRGDIEEVRSLLYFQQKNFH